MTKKIYLIGYSGRTIADIKRIVGDGVLLDIRIYPRSRKAGLNQKQLETLFGEQYRWLYQFGNESDEPGTVKLYDPKPGIAIVRKLRRSTEKDIFLMCLCKDGTTCHRHVVGQMLTKVGYDVQEYQP